MVVKVSKPEINVREKISELDKPSGTAGQAILAAETPQEQQALIGVGRRNMIINGAMQFDQRNSMAAVSAIPGTVYVTDRFALGKYGASTAAFDGQQVNVSSHPEGFKKALKATVVTTDTPSGDEGNLITYFIEGFDIYRLGYGSIYAKPLTLSFWVKSSIPGIYPIGACNNAANRVHTKEYNINSANTWEKKIITISPDTTGSYEGGNLVGLALIWGLGSSGGRIKTPDSWQSGSGLTPIGTPNSINWISNSGATFELTGVQAEVGNIVTPFEHRHHQEELALCQRYFQKNFDEGGYTPQVIVHGINQSQGHYSWKPYVQMRARPSVSLNGNTTPYFESYPWNSIGAVTGAAVSNGHCGRDGGEINLSGTFNPILSRGTNYTVKMNFFSYDAEF